MYQMEAYVRALSSRERYRRKLSNNLPLKKEIDLYVQNREFIERGIVHDDLYLHKLLPASIKQTHYLIEAKHNTSDDDAGNDDDRWYYRVPLAVAWARDYYRADLKLSFACNWFQEPIAIGEWPSCFHHNQPQVIFLSLGSWSILTMSLGETATHMIKVLRKVFTTPINFLGLEGRTTFYERVLNSTSNFKTKLKSWPWFRPLSWYMSSEERSIIWSFYNLLDADKMALWLLSLIIAPVVHFMSKQWYVDVTQEGKPLGVTTQWPLWWVATLIYP